MSRLRAAWAGLAPEQRLAAACAGTLFVTMFLPWYSHSGFSKGRPISETLTAWGAFSFVEAAVLLVAAAVLVLIFERSEGRAFHLPGGDGTVILAAGGWIALLVFYRTLDKPSAGAGTIVGVEWGIFVAILAALALAYAGNRLRAAHLGEPQLPGEAPTVRRPPRREPRRPPASPSAPAPAARPAQRPARPEVDGGEQLSFDEQE